MARVWLRSEGQEMSGNTQAVMRSVTSCLVVPQDAAKRRVEREIRSTVVHSPAGLRVKDSTVAFTQAPVSKHLFVYVYISLFKRSDARSKSEDFHDYESYGHLSYDTVNSGR